jgi:hypothetical protein
MNRSLFAGMLSLLSFTVTLAGCTKSSNPSAVSDTASSSSPSSSASDKKADAPRPRPIIVPADTSISVVLDQPVGSKLSTTGETFSATVEAPVEVDGRVAIRKGARATGIVREAKAAGHFKGGAVLQLALTSVTLGDKEYEMRRCDRSGCWRREGCGYRRLDRCGRRHRWSGPHREPRHHASCGNRPVVQTSSGAGDQSEVAARSRRTT